MAVRSFCYSYNKCSVGVVFTIDTSEVKAICYLNGRQPRNVEDAIAGSRAQRNVPNPNTDTPKNLPCIGESITP